MVTSSSADNTVPEVTGHPHPSDGEHPDDSATGAAKLPGFQDIPRKRGSSARAVFGRLTSPFANLVRLCNWLKEWAPFKLLVVSFIVLAGIQVGLQTNETLDHDYKDIFLVIDYIILSVFVFELTVKFIAEGRFFWRFFKDPWNVFDTLIVITSLLPESAGPIVVFRICRLVRVLRLLKAIPELQVLVNTLLSSIPSIFYISVLLFVAFYVYGVLGVFLFRDNDPFHWSSLPIALLTLFRVVTLEDWTDLMYINIYGCQDWYDSAHAHLCTDSHGQPVVSVLYFVSFTLLGSFIILNLFIGVINNNMGQSKAELEREKVVAMQVGELDDWDGHGNGVDFPLKPQKDEDCAPNECTRAPADLTPQSENDVSRSLQELQKEFEAIASTVSNDTFKVSIEIAGL